VGGPRPYPGTRRVGNVSNMPNRGTSATSPAFFAAAHTWRAWLQRNHDTAAELWVGFYKKGTGRRSITWPEAVDEALCFGWIDSVRMSVDSESYANRFTPRRTGSTWSAVNIGRAKELIAGGRMRPAGLTAFEARADERSATYSYGQQRNPKFDPAQRRQLRSNRKAWTFFESQPPSYRRMATWWVISAKRDETKARRLARLIDDSEHGRPIPPLARPTASTT
jgi:uncharacterized protein YdeI (YjbR/CyaY-like superfamily)